LVAVACAACSSSSSRETVVVASQLLSPLSQQEDGIVIESAYLSSEELIAEVVHNSNPFLFWHNEPLMVFRISVEETTRDIQLFYESFALRFDNALRCPLSQSRITSYWNTRLRRSRNSRPPTRDPFSGWNSGKVRFNTNLYMIPPSQSIGTGQSYEGFVVFIGSPPLNDSVILEVPIFTSEGRPVQTYHFEFHPLENR
jgi:hypothetical protein